MLFKYLIKSIKLRIIMGLLLVSVTSFASNPDQNTSWWAKLSASFDNAIASFFYYEDEDTHDDEEVLEAQDQRTFIEKVQDWACDKLPYGSFFTKFFCRAPAEEMIISPAEEVIVSTVESAETEVLIEDKKATVIIEEDSDKKSLGSDNNSGSSPNNSSDILFSDGEEISRSSSNENFLADNPAPTVTNRSFSIPVLTLPSRSSQIEQEINIDTLQPIEQQEQEDDKRKSEEIERQKEEEKALKIRNDRLLANIDLALEQINSLLTSSDERNPFIGYTIFNNDLGLKELETRLIDMKKQVLPDMTPLEFKVLEQRLVGLLNDIAKVQNDKDEWIVQEIEHQARLAQIKQANEARILADAKKIASDEAEQIIGHHSFVEYAKNASGQERLEVFHKLIFASEDKNQFCAEKLHELYQAKSERAQVFKALEIFRPGTHSSAIADLLSVCMKPANYAIDTIKSLDRMSQERKTITASLDNVEAAVSCKHNSHMGKVWGVERINLRGNSNPWIVSSPLYTDAHRTILDPNGHSNNWLKAWGNTIASAQKYVDITTLSVPENQFMETLKNSIYQLHLKNKPIIVRIMFGTNSPRLVQTVNVDDVLRQITEKFAGQKSQLKIVVGFYDAMSILDKNKEKVLSWNHSKIVAVDGVKMLTGGHNLYQTYLNQENPVHDVSVLIPGKLALVGHEFANKLWDYAQSIAKKSLRNWTGHVDARAYVDGKKWDATRFLRNFDNTKDAHDLSAVTTQGGEKIMAVGRLANAYSNVADKANVSDTAITTMIQDAKIAIFISQQAVLPLFLKTTFNTDVVNELARAINRGINVYILTSSTQEEWVGRGAFGYTSKYDREMTLDYFYNVMISLGMNGKDNLEKLLTHLHVLPTANINHEVPNHAKVVIVDGAVAYLGSHNLYDDSHAEFGVVLDKEAARELLTDYILALWHTSLEQKIGIEKHPQLNEGDYVYVPRTKEDTNQPSQNWTLGRILNLFETGADVILDFLFDVPAKQKTVDFKQLKLAPSGNQHKKYTAEDLDLYELPEGAINLENSYRVNPRETTLVY